MCILVDFKNKKLIDSKTGKEKKPSCFDDLMAWHAYLMTSKHPKQACKILKRVMNGELVMTNMRKEMEEAMFQPHIQKRGMRK